ncbi:class I SAM-dependent methyltransferase [Bradyrhizobium sp. WYCCWR 13023]|uniref:Class I SAM-dependent methyltransferase n=1 Tax=Bradyrhizobium zhengyangense TaxID=2911009 RepID=A0A9X1RKD9_9BRAD|nr:class I SAM-dependent methyltransferase [Bradyrhizobium zhengyangense]MCG2633012.1 class I SAM-dependent methyltransferase [Bradyrhizobium zhengyangense]
MPGIEGFLKNVGSAAARPKDWWLARQSITKHGAIQHVDELARFSSMVRQIQPRRVLEIGTAQGGVFWLLCQISSPEAHLISLDLPPEERYSGGKKVDVDLERLKKTGQTVHAVTGSSHDPAILTRVKTILGESALDILFIDGDHTYEGVRQDYEMYHSLVRPGGLIAFHDIIHTKFENCQVDRFWGELAGNANIRTTELIGRTKSHFGGIGVIAV